MGYQALLFCPDEKTARTVTQVLSELDFEVTACTEPFAAVKKLMAERFDAVVVDCDNEQNATLLYKSARNAPNNHSALAVAVVEGQAGVAKAFRIGANLVLTKPINVEQAKGTLRVARGLLRKNETAKSASPITAATIAPAASSATPTKPAPSPSNSGESRSITPAASVPAPALVVSEKRAPEPVVARTAPVVMDTAASPEKISAASKPANPAPIANPVAQTQTIPAPAPLVESDPSIALRKTENQSPATSGFISPRNSGAASAPAPALEPLSPAKESDSEKAATALPVPEKNVSEVSLDKSLEANESSPLPVFALGANDDAAEPSRGSKKALLAVAAVILVAAGGYAAYTRFGSSLGRASSPSASNPAASSAPNSVTPAITQPTSINSPSSNPTSLAEPAASTAPSNPAADTTATQTAKPSLSSPVTSGTPKPKVVPRTRQLNQIQSSPHRPPHQAPRPRLQGRRRSWLRTEARSPRHKNPTPVTLPLPASPPSPLLERTDRFLT